MLARLATLLIVGSLIVSVLWGCSVNPMRSTIEVNPVNVPVNKPTTNTSEGS